MIDRKQTDHEALITTEQLVLAEEKLFAGHQLRRERE